jgi:hypothetical protein
MGNPNKNPGKPNKKLKLLFSANPGNPKKNLEKPNKKCFLFGFPRILFGFHLDPINLKFLGSDAAFFFKELR